MLVSGGKIFQAEGITGAYIASSMNNKNGSIPTSE